MAYTHIKVPKGDKITITNGKLHVPDHPIVPFIEGDGTGPDIWRSAVRVWMLQLKKHTLAKENRMG